MLSRITNDVDTLGQSLNQSVTQLITSVTQIIGVLVMMLSISLPLTGVTVLTLPAAAIILTVMIHFSQPYFREQQQVLGTVNGIIEGGLCRSERHSGVRTAPRPSIEEFDRQNDRLFISGWRSQFLSGLMIAAYELGGQHGLRGRCRGGRTARADRQCHARRHPELYPVRTQLYAAGAAAGQREQHDAVDGRRHRARL